MEIAKLVNDLQITVFVQDGKDMLKVIKGKMVTPEISTFIKANKTEIVEYIKSETAKREKERRDCLNKLNGIEGLKDIEQLTGEWAEYNRKFSIFIDNDAIGKAPVKPLRTIEELKAKYPRAADYLRAEDYYNASHDVKSTLGKRATERILNGEDSATVVAEMEREWAIWRNEHID